MSLIVKAASTSKEPLGYPDKILLTYTNPFISYFDNLVISILFHRNGDNFAIISVSNGIIEKILKNLK